MNKKINTVIKNLTIVFLIITLTSTTVSLINPNKILDDLNIALIGIVIVLLGIKEPKKLNGRIYIVVGVLILFESIYKIIV
ncbi:hypothetical protein [Clostridium vincentii]|uniref:Uncharacterized protein n=1 Tax=Clostridium vincentii TaxID=52704 RepID=A0A2T0B8X7_9CLOT|nr:hypothetical protein [Clostridium vincentii]PRR80302.1 hypothetical protein CLVI_30920 [Clostridium vincentii]